MKSNPAYAASKAFNEMFEIPPQIEDVWFSYIDELLKIGKDMNANLDKWKTTWEDAIKRSSVV